MAHLCAPEKPNTTRTPAHDQSGRVLVVLDKLRLRSTVLWGDDVRHPIGVGWPRTFEGDVLWRRTRNRGSRETWKTWVHDHDRGIQYQAFRYSDTIQGDVVVEFNPAKMTTVGWRLLAGSLWSFGVDPMRAFIERLDVAFDLDADPYSFRLQSIRRRVDWLGLTPRGPQTERCGYGANSKYRVRKYDKRAEAEFRGSEAPSHALRFEVETWSPFQVRTSEGSSPCRVQDVASMSCPIAPGESLFELDQDPAKFQDPTYQAAACIAAQLGPKAARAYLVHRLGRRRGEDAASTIWRDETPVLRDAFDAQWPGVSSALQASLGIFAGVDPSGG